MKDANRKRRSPQKTADPPVSRAEALRPWLLGASIAVIVAAPLVPSEIAPSGVSIGLVMGWLVLLVATALSLAAADRPTIRFGSVDAALLAFLALHTISALVMARYGQPRQTLNMLWHWIGLGTAFFLLRQWLRTAAESRALVAVMIALSVAMSMHGYYQYFYSLPATRRVYEADPERALREAGIDAPPGSVARAQFENRLLYSTEPTATFTLTNSLAGLLAPWLICAVGIGALNWDAGPSRRQLQIAAVGSALLLAGCLVLTKSRAGFLATALGLGYLGVYGRRPGWKAVTLGGATIALLFSIGIFLGAIDLHVLTEASKSFLYRIQYWQPTLTMIADHPLLGCGPGNFQQYYAAYKLPEASETVADPHNFLLEIWSTSGSLAGLAFVAVLACFVLAMLRSPKHEPTEANKIQEQEFGHVRAVYWGALAGGPLGLGCGLIVQHAPDMSIFLVGFPVAAIIVGLWHAWVVDGRLPTLPLTAGILVLLTNLLVAGGISFAGVSLTLWILMAILLNQCLETRDRRSCPRWLAGGAAIGSLLLLGGFWYSTYQPVLSASAELAQARTQLAMNRIPDAEKQLRSATQADSYSFEAWYELARLRQRIWLARPNSRGEAAFREAVSELLARHPQAEGMQRDCGNWFVDAYRRTGQRRYLEDARRHYEAAAERYPNYNLGQAQLAWTLHLLGEPTAKDAAAEALRLDALNPHSERKLNAQKVYDQTVAGADQPPVPGDVSAEQLMLELRN